MPENNLVNGQVLPVGITDRKLIAAMLAVPRRNFVPPSLSSIAHIDADLELKSRAETSPPRFLMAAGPFAQLLQAARITSTDSVLDIGCGTGYSSAVLARLSGFVTGLESDEKLAGSASETLKALDIDNVEIVIGPLELGWPERQPYDVIVISGSVKSIPEALALQLSDGGRVVTIVGDGPAASAHLFVKSRSVLSGRKLFHATAHPLPGFTSPEAFAF